MESFKTYKECIDPEKILKIRKKYPDRIPIFVDKHKRSKLKSLSKHKYLVDSSMTLGEFVFYIRRQIKINSSEALFMYFEDKLENCSRTMGELFKTHKNKDLVLVISYDTENTFGDN